MKMAQKSSILYIPAQSGKDEIVYIDCCSKNSEPSIIKLEIMKKLLIFSILVIFILTACNKEDDNTVVSEKVSISGAVQKGPFINGTSILISELNKDLSQTGKTFNTQITDSKGGFGISNIELASNFVSLRADGFYFNEILGRQSSSQITLYALSDISDNTTINVNILSHLEKSRVENLVSQGLDFQKAKIQAQSEILKIFKIERELTESSEVLDISQEGEGNAILLAVSLILQAYHSESEMTELLSNISTDIKEDGILNDSNIESQLKSHAVYLDTTKIRSYLENKYSAIGVEAKIPAFEKYLSDFIDGADFEVAESLIEYPSIGLYGDNILDLDKTEYSGSDFSLAAKLGEGAELKVKITGLSSGFWWIKLGSENNWAISSFESDTESDSHFQYFTAIDSDRSCELSMKFDYGDYLIEYFEMGSTVPTRIKTISKPVDDGAFDPTRDIAYPGTADFGENLLAKESNAEIEQDHEYSLAAIFPTDTELKIRLKINILEGLISWTSDESKQTIWSGTPKDGEEIIAAAIAQKADLPISFSGAGKIEIQLEIYKVASPDEYMETKKIILSNN